MNKYRDETLRRARKVIDMIVKPIFLGRRRATPVSTSLPISMWRTMFLEHHDCVVDDEADSEDDCHQRKICRASSRAST